MVGEFDLGGLTFISLTVEQSTIFLFGQVEGVRDFSIELFLDYNKYELTFIRLSLEDLSIKALTIWDNIMAVAGHKSLRIIPSGEFWNRTVDDRLFHQTEAPIIDLEIIDVTNG